MSVPAENIKPSIEERIHNILHPEERPAEEPAEPSTPPAEPEADEAAQPEPKQPEQKQPQADEDDEGTPVETLAQLAEYLEADVSDLYNIKVPVDIDGKQVEVSIGEWKDSFRSKEQLAKAQKELEAARADWETKQRAMAEAFEARERQAAELMQYMETAYFQEMGQVDWNRLRTENPAEYAALRLQYQERQNQLQQLKQAAAIRWENAKREQAEALEAQRRELLAKEAEVLVAAIPEWRDSAVAQKEKAQIAEFMLSRGYALEQIERALAKDILLARDAMKYQEMKQKAATAKNKVFKLGKKVLKPGTRPARNEQGNERAASLRARLRKSGRVDDAAALLGAMRNTK